MPSFLHFIEDELPGGTDEWLRIQEFVETDTPELFLDRVWKIVEQFQP